MIRKLFNPAVLAGIAIGTSGCDRGALPSSATSDAPPAATVQQIMLGHLTPQSNTIWELAGELYDDDGNLSAAQLSDEQWQKLQDTASAMQSISAQLATPKIQVAAPGAKLQSEGTPGALGVTEVQALIDADPAAFATEAQKMIGISEEFVGAAASRDATAIDELSGRLNDVCSACHMRFWYPNQA